MMFRKNFVKIGRETFSSTKCEHVHVSRYYHDYRQDSVPSWIRKRDPLFNPIVAFPITIFKILSDAT